MLERDFGPCGRMEVSVVVVVWLLLVVGGGRYGRNGGDGDGEGGEWDIVTLVL